MPTNHLSCGVKEVGSAVAEVITDLQQRLTDPNNNLTLSRDPNNKIHPRLKKVKDKCVVEGALNSSLGHKLTLRHLPNNNNNRPKIA